MHRTALLLGTAFLCITLVVLDMTMPHLDGEACFLALRELNPDAKIVMTSGYSEQEVVAHFVGKGLAGFV